MRNTCFVLLIFLGLPGFSQEMQEGDGGSRRPHRPEMSQELREAIQTCHVETGVSRPERGRRPSEEDRQLLNTCLTAKGFEMPQPPQDGSFRNRGQRPHRGAGVK